MHNIEIFGKVGCAPCENSKRLARVKNLDYTFTALDTKEKIDDIKTKLGFNGTMTVPQIVIDGTHIGGFAEFKTWVKENSLS